MKTEYRKVADLILEKKDAEAKAELKKIISENPKYIAYKKQLSEMGFEICDVDENVYENLHEVIKEYPIQVRLKILDELYLKIAKGNIE